MSIAARLAPFLVFAVLTSSASYSQVGPSKKVLVSPSSGAETAPQQQLILKGIKASSDVIGFRVFVNPECGPEAVSEKKGYVATLYFSHPENDAEGHEGDFVVTLPTRVNCRSSVVLYPVTSEASNTARPKESLNLKTAQIVALNNDAFDNRK